MFEFDLCNKYFRERLFHFVEEIGPTPVFPSYEYKFYLKVGSDISHLTFTHKELLLMRGYEQTDLIITKVHEAERIALDQHMDLTFEALYPILC